jgi:hypothetical protein
MLYKFCHIDSIQNMFEGVSSSDSDLNHYVIIRKFLLCSVISIWWDLKLPYQRSLWIHRISLCVSLLIQGIVTWWLKAMSCHSIMLLPRCFRLCIFGHTHEDIRDCFPQMKSQVLSFLPNLIYKYYDSVWRLPQRLIYINSIIY